MTKAKKTTKETRRRRPAVDIIAAEGSFGRRLRRLEAALKIAEPSGVIDLTIVLCSVDAEGDWQGTQTEGVTITGDGFVTGFYHLSPYRDALFWGPRGLMPKATEAVHRAEVARLRAAHPEYLQPWAPPVRLSVPMGGSEIITRSLITEN